MISGSRTRHHRVEPRDVVALADGSIWRLVNLIDLGELGNITRVIDMLCMVEPA